jgi:hypothetical protein
MGVAEEGVADGTAYAPGLESCLFQALGNIEDRAWGGERAHIGGV